jgi:hypothetical protein
MKNKITRYLLLSLLMFTGVAGLRAQGNYGEVRGKVIDGKTKKAMPFVNVVAEKDGRQIQGAVSDIYGKYYIKTLEPGTYTIKASFVGFNAYTLEGVEVNTGEITDVNITMTKGDLVIGPTVVRHSKNPIIKPDQNKTTLSTRAITSLGTRSFSAIAGTLGGVNTNASGGVSFRGSRTDGTAYYIDGVRVIGNTSLTQASQSQISVIQGGVPAQFGDFTGGAINITTKGPSRRFVRSLELISSSPLDPYHFNQFEGYISGPLFMKDKGSRKKERVLLGFMLSGNVRYQKDRSPSAIGVMKVKDDVLADMEENPLVRLESGSFVHKGNYLTLDDLERVDARPNSASWNGVIQGRLDYVPKKGSVISAFGSHYRFDGNSVSNSLMNFNQTPRTIASTTRAYLKFTQNLKDSKRDDESGDDPKTTLSNAFYNIRFDYQNSSSTTRDDRHLDNIFEYGYIGKYESYKADFFSYRSPVDPFAPARRVVDQNGDTVYLSSYWEQVGSFDTLITFTAADNNPLRANYTQNYYDAQEELGNTVRNSTNIIQDGALLNGQNPPNVYSIYATPGFITANFSKGQTERYTVFAMGEAQLTGPKRKGKEPTPHDLQFGLMYEQTVSRSYGLNASGLWQLMPLLMNSHVSELDRNNPILSYDENGVFQDTIRYNRLIQKDQQTEFDKNFRNKLIDEGRTDVYGDAIGEGSFVDINSYAPEDFDIEMFSADELLNNGNAFVNYYGYDYTGKKVRGKPSIQDFLNDPAKRTIGAFQPIYTAAWVQDKFKFKDLILRLGLRVERYDANQLVLQDPYSLYPVRTVGEVSDIGGAAIDHPDNIGSEYKVYVNDFDAPTKILGYRDGDQWYNASGDEITDSKLIAQESSTNEITPYLVDANNQQITSNSFKDFEPKLHVLPRIWFSFPINEEALFFASYDVLAQRPGSGVSFATIDDYFYMREKNNSVFANPGLKSRIKTDYEIGFKKLLTDNSGISIIASYSEIRNDINRFSFTDAYPITYVSYSNIDFSTVKGFRVEYELRGEKNISLNANYTLQFARGTGASTASQQALINAGLQGLRYSLPLGALDIRHTLKARFTIQFPEKNRKGKDIYNGPVIKGKKVLKNVRANFIFVANSGLPYTPIIAPTQIGTASRSNIKGNPYGARLPWQFNVNLNLNKSFPVKLGKDKDGRDKRGSLNVFLWVENLLDVRNVIGVYPYTGNAEDDGFLNSPQGQQVIQQQLDAQAFYDLYSTAINSPNLFARPRQARIGARLNF